jgi:nitroreductase
MNVIDAIAARHSIRRFKPDPIAPELLEQILTAGIRAPSGKNRQPWRFYIVQGEKRTEMIRLMRQGIEKEKGRGEGVGSAEWSANVMEQAPVTVFIFNPNGTHPWLARGIDQNFNELVDVQSVGACIQNMLLAAVELGLGSLWICDVFAAYDELAGWLGETHEMVAAVSFGYPEGDPHLTSRKPLSEVAHWV